MKKYFRVYKQLLSLNLATLVAYRGNIVNNVISTVSWSIFSLVSIALVTSKATEFFGWKREEIILLAGVNGIFIGIFHMMLSTNLSKFPYYVNLGRLDSYLLKPIDSQFLVSFWHFGYISGIRIFIGIGVITYVVQVLQYHVSLLSLLAFFMLVFVSLVILYSIWFITVTTTIWFTRLSNIVDLLYTINGVSRFPPEMYKELSFYIYFTLLPLILIIATPTKVLIGKFDLTNIVIMFVICLVFFVGSRKFWGFALRSYTSASS